jgi:hypothetical protein
MNWLEADTAKAIGVFKAVKDLSTINEILELGFGLENKGRRMKINDNALLLMSLQSIL